MTTKKLPIPDLSNLAKIQELKDKVPTVPVTRGQLDKVFTGVLLINSVVAAVSVVLFLISSWSFFLASGAFTIPLLVVTALLYRYTFVSLCDCRKHLKFLVEGTDKEIRH